ncbi:RNA editing complex protein [Trypanosoma brucei gambiense DAL972]|uniref:RNA-editing ligase 1, mitochondrial n=1 Tax=Trypanosoma brucei gambiense (strain MHOM/CI/86/DAL972) TaxID=679716 RepID=C9ZXL1_TRYB9|nr:RNA editing complex protein [Trypanosoma brucei gambiense DAL972]CBH14155.1 RNA editing complex protein [Trypanosoma brucei gambiense DAL972]|eukprot:XP_011776426.1 RNA editing complex protein [Trypanosoma brucei gambiense DAL972]
MQLQRLGAPLLKRLVGGCIRQSTAPIMPCVVVSGSGVFLTPVRTYMPLPNDQSDFSPYIEIDLPSESRIQSLHKSGLAAQEWVACEKVHGTNFGIYLINQGDHEVVRFAKRSGIMDPNENFFGYHILIDEFTAQIRILNDLLKQKYGLSRVGRLVLNGELFGAKYKHPLVPKSEKWCTLPNGKTFPIAGVQIQREPFPQYSPELHFFAFDIKYSVSGAEEDFVLLGYDEFVEFSSKVPNLLYARALVRGTLDECLAFDVENFMTPLPALLGLGNYPLEGNLAEGVVIRHVRRGDPAVEKHNVSTIIKLRCSSFMELKHPGKQKELKETFIDTVRSGALRRVRGNVTVISDSMLPQVEAAANDLLLNNVSDGRLSNVLSKIGREPLLSGEVSQVDVVLMLAKDALKDFLKEVDSLVLNTTLAFRKLLITNVYFESKRLVEQKWKELMQEEAAAQSEAIPPLSPAAPTKGE